MTAFVLRRLLTMVLMLIALSLVVFIIIQLPPGDFMTSYLARLGAQGEGIDEQFLTQLRERYGLNDPIMVQYWNWVSGLAVGDLGWSFEARRPVSEIFSQRIGISLVLEVLVIIVMWGVAIPIGIYSAVRQYSLGDFVATVIGFIGLAIPNFLFALTLMYLCYLMFGVTITGLFSPEYLDARWSFGRLVDFAAHVWAPVLVISMAGAAQVIRVLRANLLDELSKPYVLTARAKGLPERTLILRYPVRVAMGPLVSTAGWILPAVISSSFVTSVVLNLPTLSPILLRALLSQDMHVAGALIMFMGFLTLVGTFLSDILLAWIDPRVRLGLAGVR